MHYGTVSIWESRIEQIKLSVILKPRFTVLVEYLSFDNGTIVLPLVPPSSQLHNSKPCI